MKILATAQQIEAIQGLKIHNDLKLKIRITARRGLKLVLDEESLCVQMF